MLKRVLHIILLFTLTVQLLPVTLLSRHLLDLEEDEYTAVSNASKAMRDLAEEDHKDICIHHPAIIVSFIHLPDTVFHFKEALPEPHPGAIPTPPPDYC